MPYAGIVSIHRVLLPCYQRHLIFQYFAVSYKRNKHQRTCNASSEVIASLDRTRVLYVISQSTDSRLVRLVSISSDAVV